VLHETCHSSQKPALDQTGIVVRSVEPLRDRKIHTAAAAVEGGEGTAHAIETQIVATGFYIWHNTFLPSWVSFDICTSTGRFVEDTITRIMGQSPT